MKQTSNRLSRDEAMHFYRLFMPLLAYVDLDNPVRVGNAMDYKRRADALWAHSDSIDRLIDAIDHKRTTMKVSLTEEDREILRRSIGCWACCPPWTARFPGSPSL